jgi:glucose-1-phosphate thymidylyltransferase
MWGIIPAAGAGSRIQPLAFSKELLPVGSRVDGAVERPRAVSEYLVERMIAGGATRLCFVIAPGKSDIFEYYGGSVSSVPICYAVQPRPAGLCDALFQALPFLGGARDGDGDGDSAGEGDSDGGADEAVMVGLPDTIWFPADGLRLLPDGRFSFLLFPVDDPHLFDAVTTDPSGRVRSIAVKDPHATSSWVWGAFKLPRRVLRQLAALWRRRDRRDQYFGTLVNEYLAGGGDALGVRAGRSYVDVGTLNGYRRALKLLESQDGR